MTAGTDSEIPQVCSPQSIWLRTGIDAGYCTTMYCANHDGWAAEDTELAETLWDEYEGGHCQWVVRIKNRDETPPAPTPDD